MYVKIAVYLALVCVANASLTDNSIDSDDEASDVASCNIRECAQRCRSLGFTGGVCANDRCKCDINSEEETDSVSVENRCNRRDCDRRCRRLGYRHGVCVGDRCRCYYNVPLAEDSDATNSFGAVVSCVPDTCKDACHNLSYKNGLCLSNQKCVCYQVLHFEDEDACSGSACNEGCQQMGHIGGHCLQGKCQCHASIDASDVEEVEECSKPACDQSCRRAGHRGGHCAGSRRCHCDDETEESSDIEEDRNLGKCHASKCFKDCVHKHKAGGVCVFGKCRCLS